MTKPDFWMQLVLKSMPVAELRHELENPELRANERRWMQDELARKLREAKE